MNAKQSVFLNTMGDTGVCFLPKLVVFVLRLSDPSLVLASSHDRGLLKARLGWVLSS